MGCSPKPEATAIHTPEETLSAFAQTSGAIPSSVNHTASPPPYPQPTVLPTGPMTHPYPLFIETSLPPLPTDTPVPTVTVQAVKPSKPLQRTSLESILEWIKYGMVKPDVTVFETLASATIVYGPNESEGTGSYTKEQFLEEIKLRLPSQPKGVTYDYRPGEITTLYITTRNWNPAWDFGGKLTSNCVVFDFSDQGTKKEGLYLTGVYVAPCIEWWFQGTPFP